MAQTAPFHRSSRKLTRDGITFGGLNGSLTLGLGGLRLHGVKETGIDLGICIACYFVWWRLTNEGVGFAIGARVGVLEVLRYTRARTAVQATIPRWARFFLRGRAVLPMI